MPANAAQPASPVEGKLSFQAKARSRRISTPESEARSRTWNWLIFRVAKPPLKSPLPQTRAEVRPNRIPRRSGETIKALQPTFLPPLAELLFGDTGSEVTSTKLIPRIGPLKMNSARDRKSTRLNSSHLVISYAVFCSQKKTRNPGSRPAHKTRVRTG